MTETLMTLCFFLFVMGTTGAILLLFRWRAAARLQQGDVDFAAGKAKGAWAGLLQSMFVIGELSPGTREKVDPLRGRLSSAGYRSPAAPTVLYGIKVATGVVLALVLGWIGLLDQESPAMAIVLAACGGGFGFLLPDRFLDAKVSQRAYLLERALPNALDLLVLSVEAGQSLDSALAETSRELRNVYPELSSEFGQVQTELRAGRSRSEVLFSLGQRTGSTELKKFATVLIDSDRFGSSLGPALRTHARYLRTRRRHEAQEAARKLSVKLIFPVFFLIMPSVFVITLGPAVLTFYEGMAPALAR
ncbi:MAG: type II secretion system F family protein [Acidobacteria bacterium]|nr:type II secretion system F family protein [Acidobacteriota bacterium]